MDNGRSRIGCIVSFRKWLKLRQLLLDKPDGRRLCDKYLQELGRELLSPADLAALNVGQCTPGLEDLGLVQRGELTAAAQLIAGVK